MRFNFLAAAASAALAIGFAAAAPAQAATVYDAMADFSTTSSDGSTGVWAYGWDVNNTGFTAFNRFTVGSDGTACFAGAECWYQTTDVAYSVPTVAKNTTGGTITYANSVVQPADVLNLHPGMTLDGSNLDVDAIVRFIAPTASTYSYSGFFEALDISPSGVSITINGAPVVISGSANIGNQTTGPATPFSGSVYLTAGDTIDFRVNRAGAIWNDSTGLSAQIAAVPEPAAWALMIVGFGAAGGMLRSRRRLAVA